MAWLIPIFVFLILWPATAVWVTPSLVLGANPNSSIAIYQWSQWPGLAGFPVERLTLLLVFFQLWLIAYVIYRLMLEIGVDRKVAVLAVGFFLMAPLVRARVVFFTEMLGLIEIPAFLLFFKDVLQAKKMDLAFLRSRAWLILLLLFLTHWNWGQIILTIEMAVLLLIFFRIKTESTIEVVPTAKRGLAGLGQSTGRAVVTLIGLVCLGSVNHFLGRRGPSGLTNLPASIEDWVRPRWQDFFTGETPLGMNELWAVKSEALKWVETTATLPPLQFRAHGLPWGLFGFLLILLVTVIWLLRGTKSFDLHPEAALRSMQLEKQIWGTAVMVLVLILTLAITRLDLQVELFQDLDQALLLALLLLMASLLAWLKLRLQQSTLWWLGGFLILACEFPPGLVQTPVHSLLPAYQSLKIENCGQGMRFPYVTETLGEVDYAHFLERMRGTRCRILNQSTDDQAERQRIESFGITPPNLDRLFTGDAAWLDQFVQYVKQQKLQWVVFDPRLTTQWQKETCQKLNGTFEEEGVCFPHN